MREWIDGMMRMNLMFCFGFVIWVVFLLAGMPQRLQLVMHWTAQDLTHTGRFRLLEGFNASRWCAYSGA